MPGDGAPRGADRGRRRRRTWGGHSRAHIEVRGAHEPASERLARRLEQALVRLEGVDWAAVNQVLGRVVVSYDRERTGLDALVAVVESVEAAEARGDARFPFERPEHPGDDEPLRRHLSVLVADALAIGLTPLTTVLRRNPLASQAASLLALVEATPALRKPLEDRLGTAAQVGLATGNAMAQALGGGPVGLAVDLVQRALLVGESMAARKVWEEREEDLAASPDRIDAEPLELPERSTPLPDGPVERYTTQSAAAAVAATLVSLAVTRDPRMAAAATAAATPKAAQAGREAFAATLGRLLADRGVLPLDTRALRRLDRIDTVVVDADVLTTDRWALGAIWMPDERSGDEETLWLATRTLFDPEEPWSEHEWHGWRLGPRAAAGDARRGAARAAAVALGRGSGRVLALHDAHGLAALVDVEPELDLLATPLAGAARRIGRFVVAGRQAGAGRALGEHELVGGGTRLVGHVRELQAAGHGVLVVSARQRAALAAADVGVGVYDAESPPPWGAHLLTARGLLDAWLLLEAVPVARDVSRRSTAMAAYGSGAAGLLALAGPRRGAAGRAGVGVSGAAAISMASGAWSASRLGRRSEPTPEDRTEWHALPVEDALTRTGSRPEGLDPDEVAERTPPEDATSDGQPVGVVRASLEELANPLTPALASGAALSAAVGSLTDAALIGSVMGLNALIGGVQRAGADHALRRLLDETETRVHVRRSGVELLTSADRLVVGDVVVLRAGDAVPADCRLLDTRGLEVDESSLTGESQLVAKTAEPTGAPSTAERRSIVYAGTVVAAGDADAVVFATGAATELSRSALVGDGSKRPAGVEARLRRLTAQTVPAAVAAGAALVGVGILQGRAVADTLGTGVGLAVAAVPEGLPIVATVAQLASARRLSRRDALVRNRSTLEALGRVDVLCADKTGTLTSGEIRLRRVCDGVSDWSVDELDGAGRPILAAALRASPQAVDGSPVPHLTDRAVIAGAGVAGLDESDGAPGWHVERDLPFEPSRGYHAVLGRSRGGHLLSVKGAPEVVLPRCTRWRGSSGDARFDARARAQVERAVERLARTGYRVLAVAERDAVGRSDLDDEAVAGLRLVGLLALGDPVRATAAAAVDGLRAAGVEVRMVTGDHPSTAESIAAELGLLDGDDVLTGPQLDRLTDEELAARLGSVAVFARVSPRQKVRIVRALQAAGHVVAMVGDGANDAAAIGLADVGVALGRNGTSAAKQAADLVVTDDRIETIIDAIIEGRAMWASVRDAVAVLVGGNLGEIAFTLGAGLSSSRSPLNARQLLLVNLFTDLLPAMALAVRPPHGFDPETLANEGPDASLGGALARDVLVRGALTAAAGGIGWQAARLTGVTRGRAGTVALVSLVGSQLGQTLLAGWRSPLVVGSTVLSGAALAAVVQTPGLSHFFGCRPLGPVAWSIAAGAAAGSALAGPVVDRAVDAFTQR